MIKYLSSIFLLCFVTAASGDLFIFDFLDSGPDQTDPILGDGNGLTYNENLRERRLAGEDLANQTPMVSEVTSVRGDDWEFVGADTRIRTEGNRMHFRLTPDPASERPRLRSFAFTTIVFRGDHPRDGVFLRDDEDAPMIDVWVNRVPRVWGHVQSPYRIFETDPTKGIFSVGVEILPPPGVTRDYKVDIVLLDMNRTSLQVLPSAESETSVPEPLTIVLILAGCGLFFIFRRPNRHSK